MNSEQIERLINAIRSISHGNAACDGTEAMGLEGLSIALAGDRYENNVGGAIYAVAEAINNLAEAVRDQ